MSYRLSDIKYETRNFFVLSIEDAGFAVYKNGPTASTRVASIGNGPGPQLGLTRAISEAERRQTAADAEHDAAANLAKHERS